jgi:hypothetical protein
MRIPLAAALCLWAAAAPAQESVVTPSLEWRTVETKRFTIHYPAAAEAWTLDMASRIDGAFDAVSALVGNAPTERVTVMVEDPNNESNGFALPFLGAPLIFFWPTPPDPSSGIGDSRGWGEMLSVHEYAHLAHLVRPSRNRTEAWLEKWPADIGPVALKSPRWAIEGYATWVEGKITGRGRPHSVWRAAILREWARNGQLPTYTELDGERRWLGGNMAYLVGSAYLEWLVARPGQSDSSLPHVWRRMSARTDRSFAAAFAGVFGAPPDELYGRFTAEITARAMELEHAITADSAALGAGAPRTVQRLSWNTGSPAVSPNDSLVAVPRTARDEPPVIVLWPTNPRPDTGAAHRRAKEMKRDPLDVPGLAWTPAPLPVVRTRYPQGGASFHSPRWMPDGKSLVVTRATGPGSGTIRSDLFLWNAKDGGVRRITRAGGILHADPMPDGRTAVADRCVNGICDLVLVDLATGALTPLVHGAPRVTYARPRVSPDGRTVAAARQAAGEWRVVLVDIATGSVRVAGPEDGADRYDPDWRADGRRLVVVSEAGGVPNLEEIDIAAGTARPLTRVAGAVRAPDARDDGSIFFTRLHPWGYDLDRVEADSVRPLAPLGAAATSARLAPVAFEPPVHADTFPVIALSPHPYGAGPRTLRVLPSGIYAAEGTSAGVMVSGMDPVGKLTWMAQGLVATPGTWSGASAGAAWRGFPVTFTAEAFYSEDFPSKQWGFAAPAQLDATTAGGALSGRLDRDYVTNTQSVSIGASLASIRGDTGSAGTRSLAYASYSGWFAHSWRTVPSSARLTLSGAAGSTNGEHWTRGLAELTLRVGTERLGLEVGGSYGRMDNALAAYEQFSLGGTEPPLFSPALDAQRIAVPAIPAGVMTGRQVATMTVALPVLGLRPYYWQGSTSEHFDDWEKVVGVEASLASNGIWFARLPGFRVLGGAGYALSGAWKDQMRFYLSATFRP